jgi:hypothetical protein
MMETPTGFRPASTLALVTVIGLALSCICDGLQLLLSVGSIISPTNRIDLGGELNSLWLLGQGIISLFQLPLYVGTVIVFLIWLFRVFKNLDSLQPGYREFTAGWSVGWWFVPFANLVKPFQVIREAWCANSPEIDSEPTFLSTSAYAAPGYIGAWWGLWIVSNVISNIAGRLADSVKSDADVVLFGWLMLTASALTIAAGILCIRLVRDITNRQMLRYTSFLELARFNPPPPPTFGSNL